MTYHAPGQCERNKSGGNSESSPASKDGFAKSQRPKKSPVKDVTTNIAGVNCRLDSGCMPLEKRQTQRQNFSGWTLSTAKPPHRARLSLSCELPQLIDLRFKGCWRHSGHPRPAAHHLCADSAPHFIASGSGIPSSFRACSRSLNFWILPLAVCGNSFTRKKCLGVL